MPSAGMSVFCLLSGKRFGTVWIGGGKHESGGGGEYIV